MYEQFVSIHVLYTILQHKKHMNKSVVNYIVDACVLGWRLQVLEGYDFMQNEWYTWLHLLPPRQSGVHLYTYIYVYETKRSNIIVCNTQSKLKLS